MHGHCSQAFSSHVSPSGVPSHQLSIPLAKAPLLGEVMTKPEVSMCFKRCAVGSCGETTIGPALLVLQEKGR